MARFFVSLPMAATLGCAMALTLAGCDRQSASDAQPQEEAAPSVGGELTGTLDRAYAGDGLPDYTFASLDGEELNLPSLTGQPVLLNLWATWCAPCVVEMPMLDELAADYDGRLRVVTVSQDMQGEEVVAPFFEESEFAHLESWMDTKSDLAFHYGGGTALPTTILYDGDGKEVWRIVGGYDWASPEARALVDEGLAQPAT